MQLNPRAETRLSRMIDVAYYLLMIAAFYFFMRYAFWLVFPFLFSFCVAVALQRPMNFAHRKIKLKKGFTAVVLVLLFYLLILCVIGLIGARVWSGARSFMDYLSSQVKNLPRLIKGLELRIYDLVRWLPDSIETRFNTWLADFTDRLLAGENAQGESVGMFGSLMSHVNLEWFKAPMNGIMAMAGRIPALALTAVITVIASFFMTTSYDAVAGFIKRQLKPGQRKALSAAKRITFSSLWKLLRSYLILIGVTFCEVVLGLLLLRLCGVFDGRHLLGIAVAISLVDILPVLGVGSVLVPWSVYSLIMGELGMGVGLLVIWVVVIVVRQILEPKLIASNLGLPPVATLAGMYIGLQLFGFVGLFIVPILLILLKLLNDEGVLHIWKQDAGNRKQGTGGREQAAAKSKKQEANPPPPAP